MRHGRAALSAAPCLSASTTSRRRPGSGDVAGGASAFAPPIVELREGWADQLPYADGSFDVVVSCNVFHYIPEPMAALSEMTRMLRVGGELVITDWCDDYLACRICDCYLRWFSPAHVKVYRERDCLRLLKAAGHSDARVERYKISWLWGLMTAKATKPAVESERQHRVVA